jgi:diguanylate cyclase (GGDEF)-like protein
VLVLLITQMGRLHKKYISTDDLTQACSRREIYRVLQRELNFSARMGSPFSLILFDVDHFKQINDAYGHMTGDRVLRGTAQLVSRSIRSMDCLGRWGGEEFLLVLPQTDLTAATLLAERLRELLSRRSFEGVDCVTASFGVTSFRPGQELEDLLHAADRAMYRAKQNGRNQVAVESGE